MLLWIKKTGKWQNGKYLPPSKRNRTVIGCFLDQAPCITNKRNINKRLNAREKPKRLRRALFYFLDFLKSCQGWEGCIHTQQEAEKRIDEISANLGADSISITQEIERAKQRLMAV